MAELEREQALGVCAVRAGAIMAMDVDTEASFFPRYYCPRCGPTNRIVSAHGRIICVVCEYDLACTTIASEIG